MRRLILFIQRRLVISQRLIRALHVGIQGFIHGQVLLIGCRRGGIGRIFAAEMNLPRSLRKILIPADAHARGKRRAQRCGLVRGGVNAHLRIKHIGGHLPPQAALGPAADERHAAHRQAVFAQDVAAHVQRLHHALVYRAGDVLRATG